MISLDTSIALAHLLAEDREPAARRWLEPLVSSRLLAYETWVRVHARNLGRSHGQSADDLLRRISFLELNPTVLARAREQFPLAVRTLDALHLASIEFRRGLGRDVELASYGARQLAAARKLKVPICGWV